MSASTSAAPATSNPGLRANFPIIAAAAPPSPMNPTRRTGFPFVAATTSLLIFKNPQGLVSVSLDLALRTLARLPRAQRLQPPRVAGGRAFGQLCPARGRRIRCALNVTPPGGGGEAPRKRGWGGGRRND